MGFEEPQRLIERAGKRRQYVRRVGIAEIVGGIDGCANAGA